MGVINCEVTKGFRSPKKEGSNVIYKEFKVGQRVSGNLIDAKMFRTDQGFVLPKSNLKPMMQNASGYEDIEYAEVIEDKSKKISMPEGIKSNMANILKVKSKVAVQGAVVGLIVGFAYALAKTKNKLLFSTIGSVLGFVGGNMYSNYVNEDKK
jgi:hypothetical protein